MINNHLISRCPRRPACHSVYENFLDDDEEDGSEGDRGVKREMQARSKGYHRQSDSNGKQQKSLTTNGCSSVRLVRLYLRPSNCMYQPLYEKSNDVTLMWPTMREKHMRKLDRALHLIGSYR